MIYLLGAWLYICIGSLTAIQILSTKVLIKHNADHPGNVLALVCVLFWPVMLPAVGFSLVKG